MKWTMKRATKRLATRVRNLVLAVLPAVALTVCAGGDGLAQTIPSIRYEAVDFLKPPPDLQIGEVAGVATNSAGHVFVYTRTGSVNVTVGTARAFAHGSSRLLEFDESGRFVREIGEGLYALTYAQSVRVDPQDNIWIVDQYSNMAVKFDPQGRVLMTFGRRPETASSVVNPPAPAGGRGGPAAGRGRGRGRGNPGAGSAGDSFNRPTDVAWDAAGDIFVADGFGNSRILKMDRNGRFLETFGSTGSEPGQFERLASIAVDAAGNVYAADMGNSRIQVFDNDGNFRTAYTNVGTPTALCISGGPHPYLYSSNSNDPDDLDNGEIYKMELDGRIVGRFGRAGHLVGEFGTVNAIDCRQEDTLYVGEILNWRVQKISLAD